MYYLRYLLILIPLIAFQSCTKNSNQKRITIVGHRGASAYAPENTLASFRKAIELGADMSELDVQETSDGEIILLHDSSLKRTGGVDKNIWETKYSELKNITVGRWFSEDYKNEPIPKLQEVINLVKGKMKLNIELKTNKHEKKLAERTLKIVENNNFLDQVIFTSFNFDEIRKIRKLNKTAKVGYIFGKLPKGINVFKEDVDILSVHYQAVDSEFVRKAKNAGKKIAVWTVNNPEEMVRLIKLEVDEIITNYPDKLAQVLENLNN